MKKRVTERSKRMSFHSDFRFKRDQHWHIGWERTLILAIQMELFKKRKISRNTQQSILKEITRRSGNQRVLQSLSTNYHLPIDTGAPFPAFKQKLHQLKFPAAPVLTSHLLITKQK